MRILIFGKSGQIATELARQLVSGVNFVSRLEADFSDHGQLAGVIHKYMPSHIINAAAYTQVDRAEGEQAIVHAVNGEAVGVIGRVAADINAAVIHYSTDYVFNGKKQTPYLESDATDPVNAYGRSKLVGEDLLRASGCKHLILRVSWVYGMHGSNFLRTMLKLGLEREEVQVVEDQIGAPSWSRDIADCTVRLLSIDWRSSESGVYNVSPCGEASWYTFATSIFEHYKKLNFERPLRLRHLVPISAREYVTPAERPQNSRLDATKLKKTFGIELPHWEESLGKAMLELKNSENYGSAK